MAEDAQDDSQADGPAAYDTCRICSTGLDPKRWLQFEPPCGHKYHYVCLRRLLARNEENSSESRLECETCKELVFSERDGLALMHRECSREIHRATPTDAEFWVGTELQLGRPVHLLEGVPKAVLCLKGVRCLDFTGHPIPRLPLELFQLGSIKRLVLVSLFLTELPEEIGNLEQLEQLFATGSRLRCLPGSIGGLQRLWEFYFDGNQLQSLPDPLPPRMDGLKVSGNELVSLPDLDKCPIVRNIRAYGNRLTQVPSSICHCTKLCDVLLQGNELRALPEELGQARTIRTLLLHDNYLERLPDSISDLEDLRWLYLYNNQLRELPRGLLSRASALERLLIEANPLSGSTMLDLLRVVPRNLRLVGVDALQVQSYRAEAARVQKEMDDGPVAQPLEDLPPCVVSGWMLPWGRLYGKLSPASQLRRGRGVQTLSGPGPVYGGDVLVVAFAASQGEPEWFGVLGQLLDHSPHPRISRERTQTFEELYATHFNTPPGEVSDDAARRAAAAMWMYSKHSEDADQDDPPIRPSGHHVAEFDVLSICETNAQWYVDLEWRPLRVAAHLEEISQHYRRVMFIGTSMGGFGALSNAYLAHTVAVFGPQTNLSISHLRQGFGPKELEASTARMRDSVQQALRGGTRIEYHVAMEDHLVYARHLPLPPESLVIHPIFGRIARVLERAGVLTSLLAELIAELQLDRAAQARKVKASMAFAEEPRKALAWDWTSDAHEVQLGKWDHSAERALSFIRATGRQLRLLCQEAPKFGEWFCTHCWARSEEQVTRCPSCGAGCGGAPVAGAPGSMRAWHRSGGRRQCHKCGEEAAPHATCCQACGESLPRHCVNCRSEQATGYHDQVVDVWYCTRCWAKFEAMNEQLRKEIPRQWYVEGGQRWAWSDESGAGGNGYIDFGRNGHLNTSWGRGVWELKGTDMDVAFGSPPLRRRLRRTARGFRCVPAPGGTGYSSSACTGGWPLYGKPNAVGWFPRLLQHWSMMLLRLKPAHRNRHWLLPLVAALLFAISAALCWRPPRRALQAIADRHVL